MIGKNKTMKYCDKETTKTILWVRYVE